MKRTFFAMVNVVNLFCSLRKSRERTNFFCSNLESLLHNLEKRDPELVYYLLAASEIRLDMLSLEFQPQKVTEGCFKIKDTCPTVVVTNPRGKTHFSYSLIMVQSFFPCFCLAGLNETKFTVKATQQAKHENRMQDASEHVKLCDLRSCRVIFEGFSFFNTTFISYFVPRRLSFSYRLSRTFHWQFSVRLIAYQFPRKCEDALILIYKAVIVDRERERERESTQEIQFLFLLTFVGKRKRNSISHAIRARGSSV
jgi:hypothetical protein